MSAKFYKQKLQGVRKNLEADFHSHGIRFDNWEDISRLSGNEKIYFSKLKNLRDELLRVENEKPSLFHKSEVIVDALAMEGVASEYQDPYNQLRRLLADLSAGDQEIYGLTIVAFKAILGEPMVSVESAGLNREQQIAGLEEALKILKNRGMN